MKERPILFSGEMVRAILEGRKTQTRRVVKHQPFEMRKHDATYLDKPEVLFDSRGVMVAESIEQKIEFLMKNPPYGKPGDRLWVRETWVANHCLKHDEDMPLEACRCKFYYRATDKDVVYEDTDLEDMTMRWKPSIHMPRKASRITLEITNVRVERLNDISEEDAKAEGVHGYLSESGTSGWGDDDPLGLIKVPTVYKRKWAFKSLWESINGEGSWGANPWVWVIEFKRIFNER